MNRQQRGNRGRQEKDSYSSLIMFLLLFSGFVAIIGLIYIYGDFSQRKGPQLAGFVEVRRKTPITNTPIEDASKFIDQGRSSQAEAQNEQSQNTQNEEDENMVEQLLSQVTSSESKENKQESQTEKEEPMITETVETEIIAPTAEKKEEKKQQSKQAPKTKKRTTRVFFIRATDSGYLSLRGAAIEIDDTKSPLTFTIESLLKGPSLSERSHGMYSLIPEGSRLISATVKDGVAYLDFSEDFQFNPLGTDGYQAQLQQIVYTATEFPSVQSVQILLEGKKIDYLHEGIYVGNPLSRESFRTS